MIVVDVETTGLDSKKNSIVSMGALDFFNPLNQFYIECRAFDGAEFNSQALEINGFSESEIKSRKIGLDKAVTKFLEWSNDIEDLTLAGENVFFDRDMLASAFERYNIDFPYGRRIIDLHTVSYLDMLAGVIEIPKIKNRSNLSLDHTLHYVGLNGEPKPHNALRGAKLEAKAFSRLIFKKRLLQEYRDFPIPEHFLD